MTCFPDLVTVLGLSIFEDYIEMDENYASLHIASCVYLTS
jgi:hypothetical protein